MTEEQLRELLRELRDEPVPADSLARVRMRVEERTVPRRLRWWTSAVVAAMVVAVVVVLSWPRPAAPQPPAPVTAEVKLPPVVVETPKAPIARSQVKRAPRIQAGPVIRMETTDPDVVLIMVTGGGED